MFPLGLSSVPEGEVEAEEEKLRVKKWHGEDRRGGISSGKEERRRANGNSGSDAAESSAGSGLFRPIAQTAQGFIPPRANANGSDGGAVSGRSAFSSGWQ